MVLNSILYYLHLIIFIVERYSYSSLPWITVSQLLHYSILNTVSASLTFIEVSVEQSVIILLRHFLWHTILQAERHYEK